MTYIPSTEIKQPQLHADTLGFTFVWQGHFLRGIYPDSVDLANSYFNSGFIDEVVAMGLFPRTWVSEYENEQFGMIIEHEVITPELFATEWNSAMLKDAALMVLDIAEIGWKYGYNMVDCHKLNVMFKNNKPMYVDLGSFVPRKEGCTGWLPYKNFLESYTYVLKLWTSGCSQIAKRMMSPGVALNTKDYLVWERPVYRYLPWLMKMRINLSESINALAICENDKVAEYRIFKLAKIIVNFLSPALSQHFNALRRKVRLMKVNVEQNKHNSPVYDAGFITPMKSLTCIGISDIKTIRSLIGFVDGVKIISLNESDSVSNAEYLSDKEITSVSYYLMNGGILVRDKYPETRLKSEVVLVNCNDCGCDFLSLHNKLVYFEFCMTYSTTGTMYILLPRSNDAMMDLLRKEWLIVRVSDDGTLIEVNHPL